MLALKIPWRLDGQSTAIDPGVRPGPAGAGGFVPRLSGFELAAMPLVTADFNQVNDVPVTGSPTIGGLGPRYSSNSCASCHAQPAVGGSSPADNPLFSVYQLNGAANTMPDFEAPNGPVLVPRFRFQSDLITPDGKVHPLFTIAGRSDAVTCGVTQPDFATAEAQDNLALRQVLPTFGDGMIEIIQSLDILNNMNTVCSQQATTGICGHPNLAGDNSISRLGWKAQGRSLSIFSGLETQVEEGLTNMMFPTELDQTAGCVLNPLPESDINFAPTIPAVDTYQSPQRYAIFMRFLDQPKPAPPTPSTTNGLNQFNRIGCALCHTAALPTPPSSVVQLSSLKVNLFSDLLLHHMGPCLADGIIQGHAAGDDWRTAPLWGVGQRIFFMHDGHTSDIVQAVEDHFCLGDSRYRDSEANTVINSFNALSPTDQQDIINFLRSL
jgi:CxxC motif-containing protein (DUF1111 family)